MSSPQYTSRSAFIRHDDSERTSPFAPRPFNAARPEPAAARVELGRYVGASLLSLPIFGAQPSTADSAVQPATTDPFQREEAPTAEPANRTGMPDGLKSGLESLAGTDLSDLRVHRNSPKPASIGALAYTQGQDIHIAPGQDQHLAHEAWHAVQQIQGRVMPTGWLGNGLPLNDETGLEREADSMGAKALQTQTVPMGAPGGTELSPEGPEAGANAPIQGRFGFEIEVPIFYTTDQGAGDGTRHDPYGTVLDQGAFEIKADHNQELLPLSAYAMQNNNNGVDHLIHGPPIIEMVTKPIDEFAVSEQDVSDLAENMAHWIENVRGAIGDGEAALGGDLFVGSNSPRRSLQSTLGYFQTTNGVQLSAVPLMFDATARASEKNESENTAKIEQLKTAAWAAPKIVDALLSAPDDNGDLIRDLTTGPADAPTKLITPKDYSQVGGLGSLLVNYLIADPSLGQANLAKNAVAIISTNLISGPSPAPCQREF